MEIIHRREAIKAMEEATARYKACEMLYRYDVSKYFPDLTPDQTALRQMAFDVVRKNVLASADAEFERAMACWLAWKHKKMVIEADNEGNKE